MKCPDCGIKLNKVYTKSEYGTIIELNQCPSCGGIWFDKWELYPLSREKAKHIDKLNLGKLRHRNPVKQEIKLCPICKQKLEIFKDPNLPKDFEIERCFKCGGLWLNQGETIKYKKYQEEKKKNRKRKAKTAKEKKLEKDIQQLLKLHRSPDTFGKVAKFLSIPINSNTKENVTAKKAASITATLLSLLLRLILRSIK